MPDVFSKAKRSAVMAAIRGRGNAATELRMIALLRAHGITGWRRSAPVFGKPDFVFRRERVALFVDGCFWHGLSAARHAASDACGFLGGEVFAQQDAGPGGDADAAPGGLDGAAGVGVRAGAEALAARGGTDRARSRMGGG